MSGKENQRRKEKSYLRHPLCCQSETDSDSSKETLGHVGDDDADEEDDRVQPVVAEDEGDDEEGDAKEDGDAGDDVDEVFNLLGDGGLSSFEARGQPGNPGYQRVLMDMEKFSMKIKVSLSHLPMTVLSPMLTTMPTAVPSTAFVEKKARFFVSRGF